MMRLLELLFEQRAQLLGELRALAQQPLIERGTEAVELFQEFALAERREIAARRVCLR
jgi:hypothetical protein